MKATIFKILALALLLVIPASCIPKPATDIPEINENLKFATVVIETTASYYGNGGDIEVLIPIYAFELIQIYDTFDIIALSPNIHLYYFDKEGPDYDDPGHAFAIIMHRYGREFYLFQSTIKTEQRFFQYKGIIPVEVSKPAYRDYLQQVIEEDRNGNL